MEFKREVIGVEDEQLLQEKVQLFHVLAVDDSLIDRKILEKLLTVSSYQVTCVDSGDKALEYLGLIDDEKNNNTKSICACSCTSPNQEVQGSKVNLIITDYSMPGMNGYDLLRKVKGSSWKDIPVVVMSSENVPSRINMCLEGGAEEFILKPVQLSDMKKLHFLISKPITIETNPEFSTKEEEIIVEEQEDDENQNKIVLINKRKAMIPSNCFERSRPKMEELTVL